MTDLVPRLLAAIEEAERLARDATQARSWWNRKPIGEAWEDAGGNVLDSNDAALWDDAGSTTHQMPEAASEFIARNDPAAVLRRCATDRKLLARGGPFCSCYEYGPPTNPNTGESIPHHYDCSSYEAASLLAGVYGISAEEETTGE